MDMDRISCSVLNHTNQIVKRSITKVDDNEFLCPYEKHCLDECMCCDFLACDCQMKCPKGCTCFHDKSWSTNVIQCSKGGFSDLPSVIPLNSTSLYLDGNNITTLQPGMLVGRSKLSSLSIASSRVEHMTNQSFAGLQELRYLNLEKNQLKELRGGEFSGLTSLVNLNLKENQLVTIHPDTFKPLGLLSSLLLDGNLLIAFPIWELSSNSRLQTLTLANNWWQCDCDFVRKFRMFIDGNVDIIPDAKKITCTSSETSLTHLSQCTGIASSNYIYERNIGVNVVTLTIGISVVLVALFVLTVIIMYKMQEQCLIWLHAKYGIRLLRPSAKNYKNATDEKGILFDALILYSVNDEKLVHSDLMKQLQPNYRICLLQKDLCGIYTSEAFKSALSASARHVIVLTQGFLTTEWDYVKDCVLSNTIVIVGPDIEKTWNKEVAKFLKCAKVIKWEEAAFWRKFFFYLPEPSLNNTKEGGAELDVSGLWTFTSSTVGINDSAVSTAKLLPSSTPQNKIVPPSSPQRLFPAPPIRKQPHQCSTHYLAGAPSSPCNNVHHARSFSHDVQTFNNQTKTQQPIITRSCGTNVVHHHQRSTSALVMNPQVFNPHQRSSSLVESSQHRQANGQLGASFTSNIQQAQSPEQIYSGSSIMQHLAMSKPTVEKDIMLRLPPIGQSNDNSTDVPIVNSNHQRSTSLLDPSALKHQQHFAKHGRSSSTLAPAAVVTPRTIKQRPCVQVARAASMLNTKSNQFRSNPCLDGRKRLLVMNNKSLSNLTNAHVEMLDNTGIIVNSGHFNHNRSSSTPYEGFIL